MHYVLCSVSYHKSLIAFICILIILNCHPCIFPLLKLSERRENSSARTRSICETQVSSTFSSGYSTDLSESGFCIDPGFVSRGGRGWQKWDSTDLPKESGKRLSRSPYYKLRIPTPYFKTSPQSVQSWPVDLKTIAAGPSSVGLWPRVWLRNSRLSTSTSRRRNSRMADSSEKVKLRISHARETFPIDTGVFLRVDSNLGASLHRFESVSSLCSKNPARTFPSTTTPHHYRLYSSCSRLL